MRVRDSFTSMAVTRHLEDIREKSAYTYRKVGSGESLIQAKDDAANFSISQKLRAQFEGDYRAVKNAQDSVSLLQSADAGLQSIVDVLQKAHTMAIYSASDSITDSDRAVIDSEFQMYLDEIDRQSAATNYNGKQLIDGTGDQNLIFQIGANEDDTISISLPTVTAASLGVTGSSVATREDAEDAISVFDNAILQVGIKRADIGSFISRINGAQGYTETQRVNTGAANSRLKDLDMTEGAAQMAKERIQLQTASIALSKANIGNSAAAALLQLGI